MNDGVERNEGRVAPPTAQYGAKCSQGKFREINSGLYDDVEENKGRSVDIILCVQKLFFAS